MATKFTFPRNPKIGDRIEIVSVSSEKMPINIVGNSEAEKNLVLIFRIKLTPEMPIVKQ